MAQISEVYDVHKCFYTPVAQYQIEFTEQEQRAIDKYCDLDYARRNSYKVDAGKGINAEFDPYSTVEERSKHPAWDDDFLILYPGMNLLQAESDFHSLKDTISNLGEHYIKEIWGAGMKDGCYLDVSDSWIIRQKATDSYETPFHRKHNHSFAWLTGIIYLSDTPNGTVLHPDKDIDHPLLPFAWNLKPTEHNSNHWEIEAKKGRVVIFPAQMYHSIVNNMDGDVRYTLPFNLWPYGMVNNENSAILNYTKVNRHELEK